MRLEMIEGVGGFPWSCKKSKSVKCFTSVWGATIQSAHVATKRGNLPLWWIIASFLCSKSVLFYWKNNVLVLMNLFWVN